MKIVTIIIIGTINKKGMNATGCRSQMGVLRTIEKGLMDGVAGVCKKASANESGLKGCLFGAD
ncbi:MAG: hypothetical protein ABW092_18865 [Candidatus Thiodiazotropha sp.]